MLCDGASSGGVARRESGGILLTIAKCLPTERKTLCGYWRDSKASGEGRPAGETRILIASASKMLVGGESCRQPSHDAILSRRRLWRGAGAPVLPRACWGLSAWPR